MGYACPVCDDPQADAEHLANHLAFTAMLRGDGHETWLDDRVDDWADLEPPELAEHVAEHADQEEFPQVFEDTTGGHHDAGHRHDHGGSGGHSHGQGSHRQGNHGHDGQGGQAAGQSPDAIDDAVAGGVADLEDFEGETDDVLAEARELTRARRENAGDGAASADEDDDAADADAGPEGEADGGREPQAESEADSKDETERS